MLTDEQKRILDFERNPFPRASGKAQAAQALFGHSMLEYEQALNEAVDNPASAAYAPDVVAKVLNSRETRAQRGEQVSLFTRT